MQSVENPEIQLPIDSFPTDAEELEAAFSEFEKKYFDKEGIQSTFTGHPLLEEGDKSKVDISQIIKDNKKIFSIYPGSRLSEINVLTPILFKFVKKRNHG